MGQWLDWVFWVTLAGNIAACAFSAWQVARNQRVHRRLLLADAVLQKLCVDAFMANHTPIWQAWSGAMGTIEVQIEVKRKAWKDGA